MKNSIKIGLVGLSALVFVGCGGNETELKVALQGYSNNGKIAHKKFFDVKTTVKSIETKDSPIGEVYTFVYDYVATAKEKTCIRKGRFNDSTLQVVKYAGNCLSKGGEFFDKGSIYKSKNDAFLNINEQRLKPYMPKS